MYPSNTTVVLPLERSFVTMFTSRGRKEKKKSCPLNGLRSAVFVEVGSIKPDRCFVADQNYSKNRLRGEYKYSQLQGTVPSIDGDRSSLVKRTFFPDLFTKLLLLQTFEFAFCLYRCLSPSPHFTNFGLFINNRRVSLGDFFCCQRTLTGTGFTSEYFYDMMVKWLHGVGRKLPSK